MPIEQTVWNGLLFSEAGRLWRLFGSAELIRISRVRCASPSSSSSSSLFLFSFLCIYTRFYFIFFFSTVLYFWYLGNYCYKNPTCHYCQSTLEKTQPTLLHEEWTKLCVVCVYVCVMGDCTYIYIYIYPWEMCRN